MRFFAARLGSAGTGTSRLGLARRGESRQGLEWKGNDEFTRAVNSVRIL